jgi:DNA topoisomerase-1
MVFNINLFNYFVYNQFGGKKNNEAKWKTFNHNGVLFPEPYEPHKIPLLYEGKRINLDPESEEYATIYSKFIGTEYLNNKTFNKNFFNDWKLYLKKGGFTEITQLDKCDFSLIYDYIVKHRETKKNLSQNEKDKMKEKKDKMEDKYKTAIIDGKEQAVGNFRIEPAGIFLGRGCHPKAGKIKKRIFPEDITLNIDTHSPIPELPNFYKNHKWGKIIHDNTLEWLASWKDTITGKVKYVWLGAKSDFKAKSDLNKFETARKLKKTINYIRKTNFENITNNDELKIKQLACALYLIDNLALRVGNEKGDDEADTVGVCSLRVEHITFLSDNKIKLDFLGKDSVRYVNTVSIDETVYRTLITFINNKKKHDDLFELINPNMLNTYLKSMMDELTAKVFRTYNASVLFQNEISNINSQYEKYNNEDKINLLLDLYNKANVKVAMLCNHQKNVSKSFNEQIDKMDDKINELKDKKKELLLDKTKNKERLKKLEIKLRDAKNKKELKMELKNLSLSTSKTNYIDPRITIAFLKLHNIPIEKVFSQALRDKFFWAVDVDKNWTF